ncbi:MAG: Cyclohexadienyl dehydrogenase [Turneriella sp.]|nr:Cyclohexadienyl dehydrogenase [Turneriella sp.]
MEKKPRIFIWGMGLIGASLGLKLKTLGYFVQGCVRSEESQKVLHGMGFESVFIRQDEALSALENCDILVLGITLSDSYPVLDLVFSNPKLANRLIVFDTCSTKKDICEFVAQKYPQAQFVGVHPMAGKETNGPSSADAALYEGATIYIVPSKKSEVNSTVATLWKNCGTTPVYIEAAEHDRLMAYMSHGLHFTACILALMAKDVEHIAPSVYPGAGSFRDMTRIAQSPGALWRGIILSNKENIVSWLKQLAHETETIATDLENEALDIVQFFEKANEARNRVMRKS